MYLRTNLRPKLIKLCFKVNRTKHITRTWCRIYGGEPRVLDLPPNFFFFFN